MNVVNEAKIVAKLLGGLGSGDIKVTPLRALTDVLGFMRFAFEGGGPPEKEMR